MYNKSHSYGDDGHSDQKSEKLWFIFPEIYTKCKIKMG